MSQGNFFFVILKGMAFAVRASMVLILLLRCGFVFANDDDDDDFLALQRELEISNVMQLEEILSEPLEQVNPQNGFVEMPLTSLEQYHYALGLWASYRHNAFTDPSHYWLQVMRVVLKAAAEKGHLESQYCYAWVLLKGIGTSEPVSEVVTTIAESYLEQSAQQNYAPSQYLYGVILWNRGKHLEAYRYIQSAARQGCVEARNNYYCYLKEMRSKNPEKFKKNWIESKLFLEGAAKAGLAPAQYNFALLLWEGTPGVEPALDMVRIYFRKAAQQKHVQAQYCYAFFLEHGLGKYKPITSMDLKWARTYYAAAADQGHPEASNNIAWCIWKGLKKRKNKTTSDYQKNYQLVVKYLEHAKKHGVQKAVVNLMEVLAQGNQFMVAKVPDAITALEYNQVLINQTDSLSRW